MSSLAIPEFGPPEDLLLRVLRKYFYGDPDQIEPGPGSEGMPYIGTLMPDDWVFPFLLVRRDKRSGSQNIQVKDQRHSMSAVATFETFCQGIEADTENTHLQEAVRHALYSAIAEQAGWPDLGYLNYVNTWSQPARVSDYATSTGVVQYASLPGNVVRYESIYQFIMRPVERGLTGNPYLNYLSLEGD